jgi:hypothetical protein
MLDTRSCVFKIHIATILNLGEKLLCRINECYLSALIFKNKLAYLGPIVFRAFR